jgi:hypothetical protein
MATESQSKRNVGVGMIDPPFIELSIAGCPAAFSSLRGREPEEPQCLAPNRRFLALQQ